jgi:four helix bundle protein
MAQTRPVSPELRARTERLQERTFEFAKRVLNLCPKQFADEPSRVIWRQLVRSASAASGILEEADEASSDDESIYKMKSVLRETKESRRWLKFIAACALQQHQQLAVLPDEARQLCAIFATIVRNTEDRVEREKADRDRKRTERGGAGKQPAGGAR